MTIPKHVVFYFLAASTSNPTWSLESDIKLTRLDEPAAEATPPHPTLLYTRIFITMASDEAEALEKTQQRLKQIHIEPLTLAILKQLPVSSFVDLHADSQGLGPTYEQELQALIKQHGDWLPGVLIVSAQPSGRAVLQRYLDDFARSELPPRTNH
jgi:hypothetical protein